LRKPEKATYGTYCAESGSTDRTHAMHCLCLNVGWLWGSRHTIFNVFMYVYCKELQARHCLCRNLSQHIKV